MTRNKDGNYLFRSSTRSLSGCPHHSQETCLVEVLKVSGVLKLRETEPSMGAILQSFTIKHSRYHHTSLVSKLKNMGLLIWCWNEWNQIDELKLLFLKTQNSSKKKWKLFFQIPSKKSFFGHSLDEKVYDKIPE